MTFEALDLSIGQVNAFVNSNSDRFYSLVEEAHKLNDQLPEPYKIKKSATLLGPIHKALDLNASLGEDPDDNTLKLIIKLMNNTVLRIITFFDEYAKINPSEITDVTEINQDLVVSKSIDEDRVDYDIRFKSGPMVNVFCSLGDTSGPKYVVRSYQDSKNQIVPLDNDDLSGSFCSDEQLSFAACKNNQFSLRSQAAYVDNSRLVESDAPGELVLESPDLGGVSKTFFANHLGYDFDTTDHISAVFSALRSYLTDKFS